MFFVKNIDYSKQLHAPTATHNRAVREIRKKTQKQNFGRNLFFRQFHFFHCTRFSRLASSRCAGVVKTTQELTIFKSLLFDSSDSNLGLAGIFFRAGLYPRAGRRPVGPVKIGGLPGPERLLIRTRHRVQYRFLEASGVSAPKNGNNFFL